MDIRKSMADYVFKSRYARYNQAKQRRESWEEAVERVEKMHLDRYSFLSDEDRCRIKWAFDMVRNKMVLPSMRSLQFAGPAILAHNARLFNCSVRIVDSPRSFAEIMYLLLCGCGVGIGLFQKYTDRLPNLVNADDKTGSVFVYSVEDNIEGWADSIEALLNCYFKNNPYSGKKIVFDYSKIRPAGSPLKTGGGKAPGYLPLKMTHSKIKHLLDYIIESCGQSRLKNIDIYDILMYCSDAVLSGGIRRSATIAIFDKNDTEMIESKCLCKVGDIIQISQYTKFNRSTEKEENRFRVKLFYKNDFRDADLSEWELDQVKRDGVVSWVHLESQRARSNNSVLLVRDQTTEEEFAKIVERTKMWGEPGFVFANTDDTMFNPCCEVGFIPVTEDGQCGVQMCNLTTINGSKVHNMETFKLCVEAATIIGTLQAGYTNFPYLNRAAKKLTEQEALLGVSITGIFDSPDFFLQSDNLVVGSHYATQVNEEWARKIGIRPAARVTCIKPEGSGSIVLECYSSGITPCHASPRFVRRIQANKLDNIYQYFKLYNDHATEPSVWSNTATDDVIVFPITVPDNVYVKSNLTALQHLEIIKNFQKNWVNTGVSEHNKKPVKHSVSCTVVVQDHEWDKVIKYVFKNRNFFSAVSFISAIGDKIYKQAPNEKMVTDSDIKYFNDLLAKWQDVDYDKLIEYDDYTTITETVACAGGACQI